MPKIFDYECEGGHRFEYMSMSADDVPQHCLGRHPPLRSCTHKVQRVVSTPFLKTISPKNHDYNERQNERLVRRNTDHWNKVGKFEARDRVKQARKKNGI